MISVVLKIVGFAWVTLKGAFGNWYFFCRGDHAYKYGSKNTYTPDLRLPASWKSLLSPPVPVCATQKRTAHSGTPGGWHWDFCIVVSDSAWQWGWHLQPQGSFHLNSCLSSAFPVGISPFSLPKWPHVCPAPALPLLVAMGRSRVRWPPVLTKEAELFCSHQPKHTLFLELCIYILLKSGIIRKFFFCDQRTPTWQRKMHTKSACLGRLLS